MRVVAGFLHAHDEGRVDPHHWRQRRERHRVGHVERRAQEHAEGGWRGALLAMPCVVVVCGVHIVGVSWFRVLVLWGLLVCEAHCASALRCGCCCMRACVRALGREVGVWCCASLVVHVALVGLRVSVVGVCRRLRACGEAVGGRCR